MSSNLVGRPKPTGPVLGVRNGEWMRYPGDRHLLTVAPNGAGKDVSCVNLNAFLHPGSLIVCDIKGNTAKKTARYRAEVLGHDVHIYDPYGIVPDECIPRRPARTIVNPDGTYRMVPPCLRAKFNPLDLVRHAKNPVAIAMMIAAALIVPDEHKPHWGQGARSLLAGFIGLIAKMDGYEGPRDMASVWEDLNLSDVPTVEKVGKKTKITPGLFTQYLNLMAHAVEVANKHPSREARRFTGGSHDEVRSIKQSIFTNCSSILDDPSIIDVLSDSTLDLTDITVRPTTIYLCLPGEYLDTHARWFRLMLTCILAAIQKAGVREHDDPRPKILWLCNEWASQKKNDVFLEALPRLREYGCQFWIFVQDLNQLKYWYKDAAETFVGNAGVIQTFGGSPDVYTSEYLSKVAGQKLVKKRSQGENTRAGSGISTNTSSATRPVKYPHEITNLNAGSGNELKQLLIFPGKGVVTADRLLYYRDMGPEFKKWVA